MNSIKLIKILITGLLVFLFIISGCDWLEDPEDRGPAPGDCVEQPFETGLLIIRSTLNLQNDSVPIYVFFGDLEDDQLDTFFYAKSTMKSLIRPLGEYSVVAEYLRGNDTIVVFDGDDIDTDDTEYSDKTCWEREDAEVDVRLKF